MKKESKQPRVFNSISELNQALGLPKPLHPLVSLNYYKDMKPDWSSISGGMIMNLYKISYKSNFTGRFKYGQHFYDFNEGGMCFVSPNQVLLVDEEEQDYGGLFIDDPPGFSEKLFVRETDQKLWLLFLHIGGGATPFRKRKRNHHWCDQNDSG